MKHTLQISVSKEPKNAGIAAVRHVSVRERFLRFLLGNKTNLFNEHKWQKHICHKSI